MDANHVVVYRDGAISTRAPIWSNGILAVVPRPADHALGEWPGEWQLVHVPTRRSLECDSCSWEHLMGFGELLVGLIDLQHSSARRLLSQRTGPDGIDEAWSAYRGVMTGENP